MVVVVDKIGDLTKKDCFAYVNKTGREKCYCLKELQCKNKECRFYRNDITISEIERSLEEYNKGVYKEKYQNI